MCTPKRSSDSLVILTGAHSCVVAGSVLTQGSGALGGEGGGGTQAGTALPALAAADGA